MPRKPAAGFDVEGLRGLDMDALRAAWREHLSEQPPPLRAPELLRRELAWRLEAAVHGGLPPSLRQRLDRLARQAARGRPAVRAGARPRTGSTLVREWDGKAHTVVVLDTGFLYRGETYRSLSQLARRITGMRWSGPRFFGLTHPHAK